MAASGQALIPGTSYRHGTCINVCGHDFVLTDDPELLQEYTSPTCSLTMVNSSHKGSVFMAPNNDMALGLVQFSLCPNAKSVVPHYWMLASAFEEQQQQQRAAAPPAQDVGYDQYRNQQNRGYEEQQQQQRAAAPPAQDVGYDQYRHQQNRGYEQKPQYGAPPQQQQQYNNAPQYGRY